MDCVNCEENFSAVLEEDDSAAARSSREHLQVCPACHARYESFRQTVQHLRNLPPVAPPPELLGSISRAVDAQAPPRVRWTGYWQPMAAGLSVAACLMMVLWTVVLNPVNVGNSPISSQVTQPAYGLTQPTMPGQTAYASAAGAASVPAVVTREQRRGPAGARTVPVSYRPRQDRAQTGSAPFGTDFGAWGHSAPAEAVTTAPVASSGKPAGTFAASDTPVERPLVRTPGEVQLAFTPPVERVVGSAAVGQLLVTSQAEAGVTIRVQPQAGLRVLNAPDGVLYRGALRKGSKLQLPMRLLATQAGAKRMRLVLEADVDGVSTEMPLLIPEFIAATPVETPITLVFRETPSLRALREVAAAAGVRLVVADGLESQLVNYDFSAGVPVAVALRTLCDGCGYKLEMRDGVYHVEK